MKTFTLILSIAFLFAACEKTEIPPTTSPSDDDKLYIFDTEINCEIHGLQNGLARIENDSYPDSAWSVSIELVGSAAGSAMVQFPVVEQEGYFEYAFVHDWFGTSYTDTIYGTGYFDADTAYMHYTYQPMDDDGNLYSEPKEVEIHSL